MFMLIQCKPYHYLLSTQWTHFQTNRKIVAHLDTAWKVYWFAANLWSKHRKVHPGKNHRVVVWISDYGFGSLFGSSAWDNGWHCKTCLAFCCLQLSSSLQTSFCTAVRNRVLGFPLRRINSTWLGVIELFILLDNFRVLFIWILQYYYKFTIAFL